MTLIADLEVALRDHVPRVVDDPSRAQAAVAVILVPQHDQLLLIRRAEHSRDPWSGQMGLPGGRRDPGDADLLATALRETHEEVGLDLSLARLIGAMDDQAPTTPHLPPILVRPFVFVLDDPAPALSLSAEVQYVRWVSLPELRRPGIFGPYQFEYNGQSVTRPGYHLGADVVWGMTERILTPLVALARTG
jgi:8-oxo-dGTP pyrophosphatase MutT (NUDIX family)